MTALPKVSRLDTAHRVDVHVGGRVRVRRKALRLSQNELALALGITFQQVQKYERGLNRVSASKLYEIGMALRTPVAWFFEGLEDVSDTERSQDGLGVHAFLTSVDAIGLGTAFLAVPTAEQRQSLLDLMAAMAKA